MRLKRVQLTRIEDIRKDYQRPAHSSSPQRSIGQ